MAISVVLTFIGGHYIAAQEQARIDNGVFFKIEGNGLKKPSYALGTMHYVHGDYVHKIEGFDSIFNSVECLAEELPTAILLDPESMQNDLEPDFQLTRMDSIKLNSMYPEILAEWTDTARADAFTRYLTTGQLDSLDNFFERIQFDLILKSANPQLTEAKLYRRMEPFTVIKLISPLVQAQIAKDYILAGYPMDYQMIDYKVKEMAQKANEDFATSHPETQSPRYLIVGLDSSYAFRKYQESKAEGIKELIKDFSTHTLTKRIYDTAIMNKRVLDIYADADKNYQEGNGKKVLQLMIQAEPSAYNDKYMVNGRNDYWMTQLPGLMQQHSTLMVVGLAHLLPLEQSEGVLQLLQKQGYKVTRLK